MNGEGDHDMFDGYIQNPIFIGGGEENETDNNIGAISGGEVAQDGGRIKRKRRHCAEQIQELENFFKECPHPNANQRLELGQRLNLETNQIKFWFQNKRTQARTQQERQNNMCLREENERLQRDQDILKQAIVIFGCTICGIPTQFGEMDFEARQLTAQNTKLVEEIDQLCFLGTQIASATQPSSSLMITNPGRIAPPKLHSGGGTSMVMNNRSMFLDIAVAATNELMMLGEMNCPFWSIDSNSNRESLNYTSAFSSGMNSPGYVVEATRETGLVLSTSLALVKTLMNTNQWVKLFAPIVSVGSSRKVLPTGLGQARSGTLQLIQAEFQVLSPFIPKRQVKFLRYCKAHREGFWTVVDFTPSQQCPDFLSNGGLNRLPSGLIIEDLNNGYSKVTWIEQAEYDESHIHQHNQLLIGSGIGLGTKRWLTTLQRHCESVPTLSSTNLPLLHPGLSTKTVTEIAKLAQRMTLSYYASITGSPIYNWDVIQVESVAQNMRVMSRKVNVDEFGENLGTVLSASTSIWLPVNQNNIFHFLSNKSFRHHWDILTYNTSIEETIQIEKTKSYRNYVSLLKITGNGIQILQEMWNDASGSIMVYAPVQDSSMEEVMGGENSDSVKLFPWGISIVPVGGQNQTGGGSVLTVGVQMVVTEITQDYVGLVQELIVHTIDKIKLAFQIQI